MALGIWLHSLHSVKNISHFRSYSSTAPKQHSQVTRHQILYLTASDTSVLLTSMAQFVITEQFDIVHCKNSVREALLGGDLFSVAT